ncbi:hypothetical protein D9V37_10955 [Nocardioides mangrovicus]|uniref:Uncharacterized protein n=1 Tax=Nocardioides mangrovicus TaxID=2478913 RepID=A0A3L8P2K7_9ACTN|nr:hypothetical protein [Nocardioides mangrovicus]RLV49083.1 hypothetical protein D9V37_10955 [Nocardioides mangrovicus]
MSTFRPVRYRRRGPDLDRSGGFVAMAGLACVLFLDVASVRFLPWWVVTLLLVLWVVLMLLGTAWFTPRPRRAVALPVVGVLAWLAAVGLVLVL